MTHKFSEHHDEPKDCQLVVAITGTKQGIKEELYKLIAEIDSSYGKPKQGIKWDSSTDIDVVTPVWDSKAY